MEEQVATVFEEVVRKREAEAIGNIIEYLRNPQKWDTDDKQYGLPVFWELIQDKVTQVSSELTQQSISCLTQILKQPFSQPVKVSYLIRAIDNILKGESVPQSVVIAQSIISDYPTVAGLSEEQGSLTIISIIVALEK